MASRDTDSLLREYTDKKLMQDSRSGWGTTCVLLGGGKSQVAQMKQLLRKEAQASSSREATSAENQLTPEKDLPVEPVIPYQQKLPVTTSKPSIDNLEFFSESDTLKQSKKWSLGQRYYEYLHYMFNFPKLLACDKSKLKLKIEEILGYEDFKNLTISELRFGKHSGFEILENYAIGHGISLKFLSPPVVCCLYCRKNLNVHHSWSFAKPPTQVKVHTVEGTSVFSKVAYRCKSCSGKGANGRDINYHVDKYGNDSDGWKFWKDCKYIRASDVVFYEKLLVEGFLCNSHHNQATLVGTSESYNELFKDSTATRFCRAFTAKNVEKLDFVESEQVECEEGENEDDDACKEFTKTKTFFWEASRKSLSSAMWLWITICEAAESECLDQTFLGPKTVGGERISFRESLNVFMRETDDRRVGDLYKHENCTKACKDRGCGKVLVCDGHWKTAYPLCQFTGHEDKEDYLPCVCTESPVYGKAFCTDHVKLLEGNGYPSGLHEFIRYCGCNPMKYTSESRKIVESKLKEIGKKFKSQGLCVTRGQGTDVFSANSEMIRSEDLEVIEVIEECNKDTGKAQRLQSWLRGVFFIISGGGIILQFSPIYKSENPTQVAFIMIGFLMKILKDVDPDDWSKYVLAYDNMCNVDRLKLLRKPLPVPEPFPEVWTKVSKIIDRLHVRNHKRPECKILYNPDTEDLKDVNTMICEQTFSWLARFKKTLNSLPKYKFHFFLHQLIKRRNRYTEWCHQLGKYPLLPSAKNKKNFHEK